MFVKQLGARPFATNCNDDGTICDCAETLNLPTRTVDRKWAFARAWLHRAVKEDGHGA